MERKVPVLSLKEYESGTTNDKVTFVNNLFNGIKDYGFVNLKDHPVEEELLVKAFDQSKAFFNLPVNIKEKYVLNEGGGQRGYTPFGKEHAKDAEVMDLKEFWHVGREVQENHKFSNYYPMNVWPEELPEFKSVFLELYSRLDFSGKLLLKALGEALDLTENYFDNMIEDGNSILRLLHYPPIPEDADPRCVRAAAHEDINLITILCAATESGLELKDRDGQWLPVETSLDVLTVDAGDMLSRITNEVIPATTHRVVNPEDVNTNRYSMPYFIHPHPEAVLKCLPSCVGDGPKYEDISSHDFLMQRLEEIGLKN